MKITDMNVEEISDKADQLEALMSLLHDKCGNDLNTNQHTVLGLAWSLSAEVAEWLRDSMK